jgi:hypothetical protein
MRGSMMTPTCDMGDARCDEAGVCYADAMGYPGECPHFKLGQQMARRANALAAATGTAKTPKAVECEASQSGPKGNAQPLPPLPPSKDTDNHG